jgi:hypothetical protein
MKRKQLRKRKTSKKGNKYKKNMVGRSRRLRLRLQKGGLRHGVMGIRDTWSFTNPHHTDAFREYIFGTPEHLGLWITLFTLCGKYKRIPIFIVTSGNLIGVIRTIQLLGLAEYVEEVISIRENNHQTNPNPMINPRRYFAGETKADVIKTIMTEKGIPCERGDNGLPLAAFFDDQPHNFEGLCPSVKQVKVGGNSFKMSAVSSDKRARELIERMKLNFFFNTVFKNSRHSVDINGFPTNELILKLFKEQNFTSEYYLRVAISGIINPSGRFDELSLGYDERDQEHLDDFSNIKILFLDWDETVSFWRTPPDFYNVDYDYIKEYITITPI